MSALLSFIRTPRGRCVLSLALGGKIVTGLAGAVCSVEIGDIKTPVKYADPYLRERLATVEESMAHHFIQQEIPEPFQDIYQERFKEGKDDSLEGKILSVADKVDLLYESFGEIQKGNPEPLFTEIYKESLGTILEFQSLSCVQYFLKEILPDLIRAWCHHQFVH